MRDVKAFTSRRTGSIRFINPVWDDLRFPAVGLNPPGLVSDPSRNTATGLLDFAKDATNMIAGVAQMPHSWLVGSGIEPHIHWYPGGEGGGTVSWKFEYKVIPVGSTIPASYNDETVEHTVEAGSAVHLITDFTPIDMSSGGLSTMVLWRLSRIGGDDTLDSVSSLMEVDFHYQMDSFGSDLEYVKYNHYGIR